MLTKDEALAIAEKVISQKQKESGYHDFSTIELISENDSFRTFVSGSQAMINDGYIPGAFFISVDKTDGHIWTREEKEDFYQRRAVRELQTA